jgi:AraC family transcriptional regulator of adaptative response / DNA-3-methyladenine glycosylase II
VPGLTHLFPDPARLATLDPASLPMPRARGRALVGLATALADGTVVLDRGPDRDDVRRALLALPGIGPWTADYVAMRALGHPDVFLPTDLAIRRLLADMAGSADSGSEPDPECWRPWRSYALMHLWNTLMPDTPALAAKEN